MFLELGSVQPELEVVQQAFELRDSAVRDAPQAPPGRCELVREAAFCFGRHGVSYRRFDRVAVRSHRRSASRVAGHVQQGVHGGKNASAIHGMLQTH